MIHRLLRKENQEVEQKRGSGESKYTYKVPTAMFCHMKVFNRIQVDNINKLFILFLYTDLRNHFE